MATAHVPRNITRAGSILLALVFMLQIVAGIGLAKAADAAGGTPVLGDDAESGASMDSLADALAKDAKVYRVEESIIMPLPIQQLFQQDGNATISASGNELLSRIATSLLKYPGNHIYIQAFLPREGSPASATRQAMDRAYMVREKFIDLNVPRQRLIADLNPALSPSERATLNNRGAKTASAQQLQLRIIPEAP